MTRGLRVMVLTAAGAEVGLGHLRRCLALSSAATELGASPRLFVAGEASGIAEGEACQWIASPDVALAALDRWSADVVVVDAYGATPAFLERLGGRVPFVVLLDDLADRAAPVDVVVNGGYHASGLRYRGRPDTVYLLGARYALLNAAFAEAPRRAPAGEVRRVVVTLGGAAGRDALETVMAAAHRALPQAELDVVIGPFTPDVSGATGRVRVHRGVASLRPLLIGADLAVTAGGMTVYECLASGTPVVATVLAENQRPSLAALGAAGLLVDGGRALEPAIATLAADPGMRDALGRRGRALVDGGGARRVAGEIARLVAARGVARHG